MGQGEKAINVVLSEHAGLAQSGGEGADRHIVICLRDSDTFDRCLRFVRKVGCQDLNFPSRAKAGSL